MLISQTRAQHYSVPLCAKKDVRVPPPASLPLRLRLLEGGEGWWMGWLAVPSSLHAVLAVKVCAQSDCACVLAAVFKP